MCACVNDTENRAGNAMGEYKGATSKHPLVAVCFLCMCLTRGFAAQVLDWIENHGEAFLSKHTGVGKSLHRARALQKRHEDFEEVAQVVDCSFIICCGLSTHLIFTHAVKVLTFVTMRRGTSSFFFLFFFLPPFLLISLGKNTFCSDRVAYTS